LGNDSVTIGGTVTASRARKELEAVSFPHATRVTIASARAHHGIASSVAEEVAAPASRRGQARHHGSAPRIDPRPRAINSGGITRQGDAINIRLTDWTEHGPVLTNHGGHCAASRAVTACIPPGDGFLPSQAARQLEPGASNRNGSHRHRITITARTGDRLKAADFAALIADGINGIAPSR
jgi:hypothetical protein